MLASDAHQRRASRSAVGYLPYVAVATGVVVVLPVVLTTALLPSRGLVTSILAVVLAIALSAALARAGAAYWMRRPASRDLVFADLMVWGWARRVWAERRLAQAQRSLDTSRATGAPVRLADLARLGRLLEARDADTHGHSQRVARHAERIARKMHLPRAEIAKIRTAATVHDIGKVHTPRSILNKPGRLTDEEFNVIKRHPGQGAEMLGSTADPEIVAMVRHHHERLDGRGYPDGLIGHAIPVGARIIAVADTFDAITSNRKYRGSSSHKRALDVLTREAGTQLDAAAVAAFLSYYSGRGSVMWTTLVAAVPQRLSGWLGQTSQLVVGAAAIGQALSVTGASALFGLSPPVGADRVASPPAIAPLSVSSPGHGGPGSSGPNPTSGRPSPPISSPGGGATATTATATAATVADQLVDPDRVSEPVDTATDAIGTLVRNTVPRVPGVTTPEVPDAPVGPLPVPSSLLPSSVPTPQLPAAPPVTAAPVAIPSGGP